MKESIFHHVYKIRLLSLVGEYKSFKRVAVFCGMTQSALSQNIKSLESYLGKTLVVREKGSASLTTDGQDIIDRFNPILSEIEKNYQKIDELEMDGVRLSIGSYDSIAVNLMPVLFPQLRNKYPKLRMEINTMRSDSLAKQVRKGELDMALVIEVDEDDSLDVNVIAEDHFALFVSQKNARHINDFQQAIEELDLATISPGPNGHPRFYQKFMQKVPAEMTNAMTSDSFETVRSVSQSGAVIGLMPTSVARRVSGEFRQIWPEDRSERYGRHSICLISRKNIDPRLRQIVLSEIHAALDQFGWADLGDE